MKIRFCKVLSSKQGLNVILAFFFFFSSSCASLYLPPLVPAINVKEKGDVMLMGGLSTNGFGGILAFAPSDKIAISSNVHLRKFKDETNRSNHQYYGLMVGYNHKINPQNYYKVFGGYGLGHSSARNRGGFFIVSNNAFGSFQKVSLFQTYDYDSDFFSISIGLNLFLLDFHRLYIETDNQPVDINKDYSFFIEPSVTMLFGKKRLKAFVQGSATSSIFVNPEFDYAFLQVGFGLRYNFPLLKR